MVNYIGIVDGEGEVWGVVIPDFPGVHGGGPTAEAAVADATSALREVAADMVTSGEPLPTPTALGEIERRRAAEGEPTGPAVYIPLLLDKGRSVKANISLDAGLLESIDEEAKRRGLTRSAFLASAARDKIMGAT